MRRALRAAAVALGLMAPALQALAADTPSLPPASVATPAMPSPDARSLPPAPGAVSPVTEAAPLPVPEVSIDEAARRLAEGGWAVLMRHASTVAGTGDPPGYRLDDCATQRNLSAQGRAEAAAVGQALRARGVRFDEVRSSAWCRCLDTARAVAGEPRLWPALNSFFDDRASQDAQTAAVRAELQRLAAPRNLLLVTHQVNITALAGVYPAAGELVAMRWRDGAARAEFRARVPASRLKP